jgi:hypothetical protein
MSSAPHSWRDRIRSRVLQPLDNRLWRVWNGDTTPFRIHQRVHLDDVPAFEPDVVMDGLRSREPRVYDHLVHRFTEYAYEFRLPLVIEPRRSWLIPQPMRVLEESFPMVNDPWDGMKPRPSTWRYALRRKEVTLDRAISVSYAWHNYYHFFVDALPQLLLLDALGVSRDIPVVVPEQFATTRFVRDFQQLSTVLEGRTIVVQEPGVYVRVLDATYVAKDVFFSPALHRILDTLPPKSPAGSGPDRIYLRRDPAGPRSLLNDAEISRIAERYGYVPVDTAPMSLREQIALFSGARAVVGIHGAGLTNILFRRGRPLRLLELSPADLRSTHYRSICVQFGYAFQRVSGGAMVENDRFFLPADRFEQALRELEEPGRQSA